MCPFKIALFILSAKKENIGYNKCKKNQAYFLQTPQNPGILNRPKCHAISLFSA
jgi:hypothetical protein